MTRQQSRFWRDLQVCFVRFMSLCKSVCFIRGRGEHVFVSSELGSVWRDMLVPVCFSASFCGLNLRTVPQLSLNKFTAPLGYRGLVLGLKVGKPKRVFPFFEYFEWSTWRANSTKRKSWRRLRHMQKLGAVRLAHLGHVVCFSASVQIFIFIFF